MGLFKETHGRLISRKLGFWSSEGRPVFGPAREQKNRDLAEPVKAGLAPPLLANSLGGTSQCEDDSRCIRAPRPDLGQRFLRTQETNLDSDILRAAHRCKIPCTNYPSAFRK